MSVSSFQRRGVLRAATLRGSLFNGVPMAAQAASTPSPITLVKATDASFSTVLAAHFPGAMQRLRLQGVMPFVAILVNTGSKPVKAAALQWTIQSSGGDHTETLFHHTPAWVSRNSSRPSKGVARRNLIGAGRAVLLTPASIVTSGSYSRGYSPNLAKNLTRTVHGQFYAALAGKIAPSTVSASIQGTYFADETISGSQGSNLHRHVRLLQNAEHDQALAAFHAVKESSPSKVPLKLAGRRFKYLGSNASRTKRDYQFVRKVHAAAFTKLFRKHGQQQAIHYLAALKKLPKISSTPETKA